MAAIFCTGDRVQIHFDPPRDGFWVTGMDPYCGRETIITKMDTNYTVRLDVDGGRHMWKPRWLTKMEDIEKRSFDEAYNKAMGII